jgi:hypothetical protein
MPKQPGQIGKYFGELLHLLQERKKFLDEVLQGIKLSSKIMALFFCSSIFFSVYGIILGASHSWVQAIASGIKFPVLYLMTLIICLPSLFFFNVFFGSRKTFAQHLALLMAAMAVISVLEFSFAPITLLFLTTTTSYQFFVLLNVAICGLTGFLGIKFFYQAMEVLDSEESVGHETRHKILQYWLILYGLVGCQLGWTLRPFFGTPGSEFQLFRSLEGNFYLSVWHSIQALLGF